MTTGDIYHFQMREHIDDSLNAFSGELGTAANFQCGEIMHLDITKCDVTGTKGGIRNAGASRSVEKK